MKIADVKASIPRKGLRVTENVPGPLVDNKETRENVCELSLVLDGEDFPDALEAMFPGSAEMALSVGEQDGGKGYAIARGEKSSAHSVTLRHDKDAAVLVPNCELTIAKLKVCKRKDEGKRFLVVKATGRLTETQTLVVSSLIGVDIVVGIEPAQLNLPDAPKLEAPAEKSEKKGRAKRKTKLTIVEAAKAAGTDIETIAVNGTPVAVTLEKCEGSDAYRWDVKGFEGCSGIAPEGRDAALTAAHAAVSEHVKAGA